MNTHSPNPQEKNVTRFFLTSIILKGIISFLEIVAGIAAFFVSPTVITGLVSMLLSKELSTNPHDFVATHLLQASQQFSFTSQIFIAVYLLTRGLIKLVLVLALLKDQLWAYPLSLIVLALFVFYQTYQMIIGYSTLLLLLTIFDLVVMYSIWLEYGLHKKFLSSKQKTA